MCNAFTVKSRLRDYQVRFVGDFGAQLKGGRDIEHGFSIVDRKVMDLYRAQLGPLLPKERLILVDAQEDHKTLEHCQGIIKSLVEKNIRKNHTLVAIGGGIIEDITAFVACILFRGVTWKYYPTTLLAQADSCIGSKSSLNFGRYKNLLGTFYPPAEIVVDVRFLQTLPIDEIKSGIGEILHFYFVAGSERAKALMDNYGKLVRNPLHLDEHIRASLEIKRKIVEVDEYDERERNLFNYGHTFGHAIETISQYSVNHGQAVTMGMDIANFLSVRLGYLTPDAFGTMHGLLKPNLPQFRLDSHKVDEYCLALSKDKKNLSNNLTCILTSGPGSMQKVSIPLDDKLKEAVTGYFKLERACSVT